LRPGNIIFSVVSKTTILNSLIAINLSREWWRICFLKQKNC
jgi:hypothetical protein